MGKEIVKHLRNHGFYSTEFKDEELQGEGLKTIVKPPLKPAQPNILSLSLCDILFSVSKSSLSLNSKASPSNISSCQDMAL